MNNFSDLKTRELERISAMPGYDALSPTLQEAIRKVAVTYLHTGAVWALARIVEGGPEEVGPALQRVGIDLLTSVPKEDSLND